VSELIARERRESVDVRSLYRRLAAGDHAAFAEFFRLHHAPLIRAVTRLIGTCGEVEEIVQEAFLRLLEHGHLDPEKPIKALLFRIAMNLAKNLLRSQERERKGLILFPTDQSVRDPAEYDDATWRVLSALRELPEQHREILELVYGEGFSHEEVAEFYEINVDTARQRLHRARRALRDTFLRDPEKLSVHQPDLNERTS